MLWNYDDSWKTASFFPPSCSDIFWAGAMLCRCSKYHLLLHPINRCLELVLGHFTFVQTLRIRFRCRLLEEKDGMDRFSGRSKNYEKTTRRNSDSRLLV